MMYGLCEVRMYSLEKISFLHRILKGELKDLNNKRYPDIDLSIL